MGHRLPINTEVLLHLILEVIQEPYMGYATVQNQVQGRVSNTWNLSRESFIG